MSKITSVEPQKKNPKRFNIFLDGLFAFGADEDLVVEKRLILGKSLDVSDVEQLLFEAEVGKLIERMYRLFNIRQRSEKEIRDYLKNLSFKRKIKETEEVSIQATELLISKLKQKGFLNDLEFARSWFESRSKKKGIQVIKAELYKKGINKEIIEEVISHQASTIRQKEVAERLLETRWLRLKNLPILEKKKKAYEFLLRRGFDIDLVKEAVEKLLEKEYTLL